MKEPKRIRPTIQAMEIGEGHVRSVVAKHVQSGKTMGAYIVTETHGEMWIARTIDDRVEISLLREERALCRAVSNCKLREAALAFFDQTFDDDDEKAMVCAELLEEFINGYKPGGVMFTDEFEVSGTPENPIIDVRTYTSVLET